MTDQPPPDVIAAAEPFLAQCGSCDYGLEMGCACPKGDPRVVMSRLVTELTEARTKVDALVAERDRLRTALANARNLLIAAGIIEPDQEIPAGEHYRTEDGRLIVITPRFVEDQS
jgi:hypothetical protein